MRVSPHAFQVGLRRAARAAPMLALCGCAGYNIEGTRYRNANLALNAQSSSLDKQVATVAPLAYVGGSVLLPLPADREITSPPYAQSKVNSLSPTHSFLTRFWRREIKAAADALVRSEVFDSAEVRRTDDPGVYAREYGYRFLLRDQGRRWYLEDMLTGRYHELHGVSLRDLTQRTQFSASVMQNTHEAPTARGSTPAVEELAEDKHGGYRLGVHAPSLEARARILARIRAECSGSYRIDDEFLQDGTLTLRFTCLSQRVSAR